MEDLSHYNSEGSVLRKAQMRLLEMLDIFAEICDRHNITYWLVCGTALGARRHGGFIPWDDDLDVAVLRNDYKKLLSILKDELPSNLKLQHKKTDENYWFYWAKIRDTKSRYYEKGTERYNFHDKGLFIDIFSLEPVPSIQFKKVMDKFVLSENRFKRAKSLYERIKYTIMISFLPFVNILITITRFYYKWISSTKLYSYSYGIFYYSKYNMDNFLPPGEIEFEGKSYKVPGKLDKYLADKYGPNFMVVPKVVNRQVHALKIEFF